MIKSISFSTKVNKLLCLLLTLIALSVQILNLLMLTNHFKLTLDSNSLRAYLDDHSNFCVHEIRAKAFM